MRDMSRTSFSAFSARSSPRLIEVELERLDESSVLPRRLVWCRPRRPITLHRARSSSTAGLRDEEVTHCAGTARRDRLSDDMRRDEKVMVGGKERRLEARRRS